MASQVNGEKGFVADSDMSAYSRVKLASASGTHVVLAGAGEAHIGTTQHDVLSGNAVSVRLAGRFGTHKVVAAGSFAIGATLYGAAAGAVDDAVSGTAIGTALDAASGAGSIVEMFNDNGAAGAIAPANVIVEAANQGAVPIIIRKTCAFDTGPTAIAVATAARNLRIVDWFIRSGDTTAANITVKNAGTSISTAVLAKGATLNAIVHAASLVEAQATVASGAAITAESSVASVTVELVLICVPIT